MNNAVSLRPYQLEALDAIAEAENRGIRRQLVAPPTGALESEDARQFLAAMPSAEALMPPIEIQSLGPLALPRQALRVVKS